ncbi:hypothetical protein L3Q82_005369 [Scortum barcoo]|uniref:Uncharacterized protein n=1 Tax=Scortum barcoo TaxID=214431 RepID=A0ACB8VA74_9TELE|nr:hypothetical protein L3Q82_005369 [Scortum barcoo]
MTQVFYVYSEATASTKLSKKLTLMLKHSLHLLQGFRLEKGDVTYTVCTIIRQDNDPKHTSRLCKGYLTKKESDGVLRQMTWPPQSPDLNPIEMVWALYFLPFVFPSFFDCLPLSVPVSVPVSLPVPQSLSW